MLNTNFFLTDIMKTGNHLLLESFLDNNTLSNDTITYSGEYYTLQEVDLEKFSRKFAIIDHCSNNNRLWNNAEYWSDLTNRINKLHRLGFVFIIAYPWESSDTFDSTSIYTRLPNNIKFIEWTGGDSWFWSMMYNRFKNTTLKFDHSEKKYDFLYLNKFPRTHRVKLYEKLKNKNILKNSLYSFLGLKLPIKLPQEYELPWVDHNFYPRYGHDRDIFEHPYNVSAYNIVSETTDSGELFMTEKIWKPIIAGQPFIIHSNSFYLKHLRTLGFKTFKNYLDESYDEEIDSESRINKIVKTCSSLVGYDHEKFYDKTKEIREHNTKIFFDKKCLGNVVNNKLLSFFKFFDSSQVSS